MFWTLLQFLLAHPSFPKTYSNPELLAEPRSVSRPSGMERLGQTRAAEGKRAEKVTEGWMGKRREKDGGREGGRRRGRG